MKTLNQELLEYWEGRYNEHLKEFWKNLHSKGKNTEFCNCMHWNSVLNKIKELRLSK